MVPREVCTESPEKGNHYREVMLSVQKSAEVIVAGKKFLAKDQINSLLIKSQVFFEENLRNLI